MAKADTAEKTATPPRLRNLERPPVFKTPAAEQRWYQKQDGRQRELEAAWKESPPGTKLYVSARALPTRTRAGIRFTSKATTTVEVVDQDDATIAARVARGEAVVSPVGAAAILADRALVCHGGPQLSRAERAEADRKASEERAELERLRAENARLKGERAAGKSDGRPERLAPTGKPGDKATPPATDDKAGEFGDDKAKA